MNSRAEAVAAPVREQRTVRQYFLVHVVLVHNKDGTKGEVLELPSRWDKAGFQRSTGKYSIAVRKDIRSTRPLMCTFPLARRISMVPNGEAKRTQQPSRLQIVDPQ